MPLTEVVQVGPDSLKHAIDRGGSSGRLKTSEIHTDAVHWAHGASASSVEEFRFKKKRRSSENKRVRRAAPNLHSYSQLRRLLNEEHG